MAGRASKDYDNPENVTAPSETEILKASCRTNAKMAPSAAGEV